MGINPDEHLHENARTSVSIGPSRTFATIGSREGHSSTSCGAHTSFEFTPRRAPVGRKPRTSQPTSSGRQEVRERSLRLTGALEA